VKKEEEKKKRIENLLFNIFNGVILGLINYFRSEKHYQRIKRRKKMI